MRHDLQSLTSRRISAQDAPGPVRGSYGALSSKIQAASALQKAHGRPGAIARIMGDIDPNGGSDFVTEAEVYALLEGLGIFGLGIAPETTDTDAISSSSTAISTPVALVPGSVIFCVMSFTGAVVGTNAALGYSSPTVLSTLKWNNNSLNNGNSVPFMRFTPGQAVAAYQVRDSDNCGGSGTFTASALCDYTANDAGTVVTSYWRSIDELRLFLDLARGGA